MVDKANAVYHGDPLDDALNNIRSLYKMSTTAVDSDLRLALKNCLARAVTDISVTLSLAIHHNDIAEVVKVLQAQEKLRKDYEKKMAKRLISIYTELRSPVSIIGSPDNEVQK